MLAKKERIPRLDLSKRPLRTTRFLYGSVKELSGPPQGAVVISKKVAKTAPARNRVRRRIYTLLRGFIREGALSNSVIVYPNAAALSAPFRELKQALRSALRAG